MAADRDAASKPYDEGALRELAAAFWPHRDTYLGKCAMLRIFKLHRKNREACRV